MPFHVSDYNLLQLSLSLFPSHTTMASPAGQISLTGIVILANPRSIDPQKGKRNVAFDVTLPTKDGNKPTLGLLRYFTPENRVSELQKTSENTFTPAFVISKVCIESPFKPSPLADIA
jgi:hypothetical protein